MPTPSNVGRGVLLALALLAAWLAFAILIAPPLIIRAYSDPNYGLFSRLIVGRSSHQLSEYLRYWRNVTWLVGFWCLAFGFVGRLREWIASPRFFERFVGRATPGALGAIRSWTCGILFAMTVWEDLASTALLPRSMIHPKGVLHLLHALPIGFDRFLANADALRTFEHLTAFLLLLGVVGLGSRIVVPAAALCYLVMAGILREYAWFYHTGLIPIYVLAILSFTPCGDGWSFDRIIRLARGRSVPPAGEARAVYGWSRYLVWTVLAIAYVAAGLSKLYYGGLAWMGRDNTLATLLRTTLAPMEFDVSISLHLVQAPGVILILLAAIALLTELLFGFVLFSRVARRVLPIAMAMTHVGILFLQNILFPDLILLQAVFYDYSGPRLAVGRWLTRSNEQVRVLFDGRCGLCQRAMKIAAGLDFFHQLSFLDFRTTDAASWGRLEQVRVDTATLEHQMAAISIGRLDWGFSAYRLIAWRLPLLWVVVPFLYLPGVRQLGDAVYRSVAERRHDVCRVDFEPVTSSTEPRSVHLRGASACLLVAAFLLSWWTTHIEFYPFTTMKMFAALNKPQGRITYVKPVAIYDDGQRRPAEFDQWIGAMADSRYRQIIAAPFQSRPETARCDEFLDASIRAANRKSSIGGHIVGVELQSWEWDFVAEANDPQHGHLVDKYVYYAVARP